MSVCKSICVLLCQSVSMSVYYSASLCNILPVGKSVCVKLCQSVSMSVYYSASLCNILPVCKSVCESFCLLIANCLRYFICFFNFNALFVAGPEPHTAYCSLQRGAKTGRTAAYTGRCHASRCPSD